ncbi:MAG: hypothetical protein ABW019_12305 [Chitinophagaceae bacterium]
MKLLTKICLPALLVAGVFLAGCDKTKPYDTLEAEAQVHFVGEENQIYSMAVNPAPVYNVVVGTTDVADVDRTVTFNVSSPTGAVAGTHYTLGTTGNTVVIKAGEATVNIPVQGNYSQFTSGQKHTLVFSLKEPTAVKLAGFMDTVRLVLRGPCFDGVDINDPAVQAEMLGDYNKSNDAGFGAWGPYKTTIKSITPLTATTARAVINNVWDAGFGDVNFIINWSNTANVTINVETATVVPSDAGVLNSAYAGMFLVIRKHASADGKFSVCTGSHTLRYQLGVYNPATSAVLGYFATVGITTLAR